MTPNEFLSMIAQLRRERDKARHEIEGLKNKWNSAVTMAARAENERDEAREELAIARETLRLIAEEGGQTIGRTIIPDGAWCAEQARRAIFQQSTQ